VTTHGSANISHILDSTTIHLKTYYGMNGKTVMKENYWKNQTPLNHVKKIMKISEGLFS
jgi:hypothetical protein